MKNVTNNSNYSAQEFVRVLFLLAGLIGVVFIMYKVLLLFNQ
ncbi:hypothetical protein [Spongiivirga citrea]|nr:hypothetical protein [Spongiivirga citrea]